MATRTYTWTKEYTPAARLADFNKHMELSVVQNDDGSQSLVCAIIDGPIETNAEPPITFDEMTELIAKQFEASINGPSPEG
jgi:hypothetical protein